MILITLLASMISWAESDIDISTKDINLQPEVVTHISSADCPTCVHMTNMAPQCRLDQTRCKLKNNDESVCHSIEMCLKLGGEVEEETIGDQ